MKQSQYQKSKQDKESLLWEQYTPLKSSELILLLDHKDAINRREAAKILQLRGGGKLIKLAQSLCVEPDYRRRAEGAFILGQIEISPAQAANIVNLLNTLALDDKSAIVRGNAVAALGHRCSRNPDFSSTLAKMSAITTFDRSASVRVDTACALACINDESTVPLLLKLLSDSSADVRNWAAFALNLNMYDSQEIRDSLVSLLSEQNEEIKGEAIVGLAMRHDKRTSSVLRHELEKEIVFDDLIEAAGELGDKSLLPVLRAMIDRFDDNELIYSVIDKLEGKQSILNPDALRIGDLG